MNLTISGHHLDVTPALREYVVQKLERIVRHFDQVVDVKVLLSVDPLKTKTYVKKLNAIFMSRAEICLLKVPTPTCTPRLTSWLTSSIDRCSSTKTRRKTTTISRSSACLRSRREGAIFSGKPLLRPQKGRTIRRMKKPLLSCEWLFYRG